jgi:ceramide glucosyltransferase
VVYLALTLALIFGSYWVAQLVFVALHRRWSLGPVPSDTRDEEVPVTVIHPIKDLDFELALNLESWFRQDYRGAVQHIFSFQAPDDPAIAVVREVAARHPGIDAVVIVNPRIEGLNGKSSNMVHAMAIAKHEIVLFGDSDTRVVRDFILKMVRPLADPKVGVTTCGQMNIGGRTFWTRFFTFLQNCETAFNWAFLARMGLDVGITGAAFAMRKALIKELGGLESFGQSLLEDMHLGNQLYRTGYKIVLGPFVACHVERLGREKSFNYAKRLAIGIKTHIALEMPAILLMVSWYWALLAAALLLADWRLLGAVGGIMLLRTVLGLLQRPLTGNRIRPVDLVMPLAFDLIAMVFLVLAPGRSRVMWRGVEYEIAPGGYIER